MNKASQDRYEIAKRIGTLYAANPHVAAVILGGSTARGHADRFSDVELGVFWHESPSDQERQLVIQDANAELIGLYDYDSNEQVWSDDFMISRDHTGEPKTGLLVEVSHYKRDFIDYVLQQVIKEYSTNELWHNLISGIVDAKPLHGDARVKGWQEQATRYPRELSAAIVRNYGVIDHFWRWEMFLARGENLPMIYQSFTQVHHRVLNMLLGLNRVYYFGFKWLDIVDQRLTIKPDRLLERIRSAYQLPPAEGAKLVIDLVEDTFTLMETHLPEVDVKRMREVFRYKRPTWELKG
jgi:hypothetical protein